MSSNSSRRQDNSYTTIPEEYDTKDREALFFLHTRPLDNVILQESEDISFYHWSLVAVFQDETIRTMEGNECNGRLMPYFMKESPRDGPNSHRDRIYQLSSIKTSPLKLQYVTKNNSLNGTDYSVTSNNCQCWVKSAARLISYELVNRLSNYKSNKEVNIVVTAAKCSWASSKSSSKSISRSLLRAARFFFESSHSPEHHCID